MTSLLHRPLFAHPWLLWLLPALGLLGLLALWARHRRRRSLGWMGGGAAFASTWTHSRRRGPWLFLCWWLGLSLLVVGAAGPQWGQDWNQSVTVGRDLVVVLDLSRSMLAEPKSRLARAREALLNLAEAVRREGGHRVGLVLFAGNPRLACPLTHDYDHFRQTIEAIDEAYLDSALWAEGDAVSGTRIGAALELAVGAHTPEASGAQEILLLSDGDDPGGDEEWRRGIEAASAREIAVHVVGIGNPERSSPIPIADEVLFHDGEKVLTRLEEGPLKAIARDTGGSYVALHTSSYPLGELYLSRIAGEPDREHGVDRLPVYIQRAEWFLTPALVLLAGAFFLGEGRRIRPARSRLSLQERRARAIRDRKTRLQGEKR